MNPAQGTTSKHAQTFDAVAVSIGGQIAAGVLARVDSFPLREANLGLQTGEMDSLPEDILWEGLGEESAPVFVVYKLIHEAFSTAPQFFRAAIVEFLRAQPTRFNAIFNRETIWSVMTALPGLGQQHHCPSPHEIAKHLQKVQRRGIWWRSDEEIEREARAVYQQLTGDHGTFQRGLAALRCLQLEKGHGLTAGNILLMVPGRLVAYAEEVCALGAMENLPSLKEMNARVDEFARDKLADFRNTSIPLDLMYTTEADDLLHVRMLVRAKADPAERAQARRRLLYLRYFIRKVFAGYKPDQLDVKLAFYLDSELAHMPWHGKDSLFHSEEWINRKLFWNELCPGANPATLFSVIRGAAAAALGKANIVEKLKSHFNRTAATRRDPANKRGRSSEFLFKEERFS